MKVFEQYQNLADKLIAKSFPKLRKREVKIIFIPWIWNIGTILKSSSRDYIILWGKCSRWEKKLRNKKAIIGFMVHELCHVEELQDYSVLGAFIRYNILTDVLLIFPYVHEMERNADMMAIKKGYAKELYENIIKGNKKYPKWVMNYVHRLGYISAGQIKQYAKKIGKW